MIEEQITIQVGSCSNYVGTHFWNFQDDMFGYCTNENDGSNITSVEDAEEDKHYCQFSQLFRSGKINGKDLSTPRAVVIDRRGTLGSLNPLSVLEPPMSSSTAQPAVDTWDQSKTSIFREDIKEKNAFLRMLEQQDNYFEEAQNVCYDKYGRIVDTGEAGEGKESAEMEEEVEEERFQQGELHDADVKAWSDFLKVHLHPTSVIELPFWSFNEPFSTFAAGVSKSTISAEHRDNYFDTVRQFAEECDYLRNITVLADLHDGFGGLTCSLMEEIRDEFPRMTVPVWGFTDNDDTAVSSLQEGVEEESVGSLVIPLFNVPLCYASLAETASVVIPISTQATLESSPFISSSPSLPYHSSAIIASALELSTGYQRLYDSRASTSSATRGFGEWAQSITCNNRFKFCNLESTMPFPLNTFRPAESLWATYDVNNRVPTSYSMNPFMRSLSAAVYGKWSADPIFLGKERLTKSFSNVLTIRGCSGEDIPGDFYRHCRGTKHPISQVYQRGLGLPIPNSFPTFFRGVTADGLLSPPKGQSQDLRAISHSLFPPSYVSCRESSPVPLSRAGFVNGMASVGCDGATMGRHLANVRECWALRSYKARLQLEQVGIPSDDCKEVEEALLQLEESYGAT